MYFLSRHFKQRALWISAIFSVCFLCISCDHPVRNLLVELVVKPWMPHVCWLFGLILRLAERDLSWHILTGISRALDHNPFAKINRTHSTLSSSRSR